MIVYLDDIMCITKCTSYVIRIPWIYMLYVENDNSNMSTCCSNDNIENKQNLVRNLNSEFSNLFLNVALCYSFVETGIYFMVRLQGQIYNLYSTMRNFLHYQNFLFSRSVCPYTKIWSWACCQNKQDSKLHRDLHWCRPPRKHDGHRKILFKIFTGKKMLILLSRI